MSTGGVKCWGRNSVARSATARQRTSRRRSMSPASRVVAAIWTDCHPCTRARSPPRCTRVLASQYRRSAQHATTENRTTPVVVPALASGVVASRRVGSTRVLSSPVAGCSAGVNSDVSSAMHDDAAFEPGPVSGSPRSATPMLSINDVAVVEGDAGTTDAVFTSRFQPPAPTLSRQRDTSDDSATAPDDYVSLSTAVLFDPGDTSETVSVQVKAMETTRSTRPSSSISRPRPTRRSRRSRHRHDHRRRRRRWGRRTRQPSPGVDLGSRR